MCYFGHGTATRSKSHWVQHTQKVEQGLLHPTFSSFPPIERLRAFCIMSFSSSWWLYYTQAFRRHCLLDRKLIAKNLIIYRWKNCGSKYWVRLAAKSILCSINLKCFEFEDATFFLNLKQMCHYFLSSKQFCGQRPLKGQFARKPHI